MLTHVVLMKLHDRRPENVAAVRARLLELADHVPPVRYLEAGANVVESDRAFDLALIVRFDSLAELEAYQVHPYHVAVLDYLRSRVEKTVAVDYESRT